MEQQRDKEREWEILLIENTFNKKKRYFIFCFTKAKGIRTTEGNALSVEKYLIKTLFKETEQSL